MKKLDCFSVLRSTGVAVLGCATLLGFSSCNDEEKEAANDKTAEPAAVAPGTVKRDALFENLLYTMSKSVTASAANPALSEIVRNHLVLLQEYYDEMAPANAGTMARTKLAVRIAQVFSDLTSFSKSVDAFNKALEDFNAMSDADKNSAEGQRILSTIYTGLGSGLLSQRNATDALPNYEKALEVDLKALHALLPEDKMPVPEGEVDPAIFEAASEVISSYNCLAFCQRVAEDPEEARETIKKCQDLVQKMNRLSPAMSMSYVRLLTTLGDLESACGKLKEAYTAWVTAASICKQVYDQIPQDDVRAEANMRFRQLATAIRAVQEQIGETAGEAAPAESLDGEAPAPAEGAAPAAN